MSGSPGSRLWEPVSSSSGKNTKKKQNQVYALYPLFLPSQLRKSTEHHKEGAKKEGAGGLLSSGEPMPEDKQTQNRPQVKRKENPDPIRDPPYGVEGL